MNLSGISIFSGKKKLLLLLIPVFLIALLVIIFIVNESQSEQTETQTTLEDAEVIEPTIAPLKDSTMQTLKPSQSRTASKPVIHPERLWNTYQGSTYRFQHPKDWKTQVYSMTGGESVLVKPQLLPEGINYPQFVVQTQQASDDVIARKEGVLAGFGMVKEAVIVNDTQAIRYKGTIPFKTVGTQTVMEPVQDTTYLLEKNGIVYILKFEYEGASINPGLDEFIDGFVFSFKAD